MAPFAPFVPFVFRLSPLSPPFVFPFRAFRGPNAQATLPSPLHPASLRSQRPGGHLTLPRTSVLTAGATPGIDHSKVSPELPRKIQGSSSSLSASCIGLQILATGVHKVERARRGFPVPSLIALPRCCAIRASLDDPNPIQQALVAFGVGCQGYVAIHHWVEMPCSPPLPMQSSWGPSALLPCQPWVSRLSIDHFSSLSVSACVPIQNQTMPSGFSTPSAR